VLLKRQKIDLIKELVMPCILENSISASSTYVTSENSKNALKMACLGVGIGEASSAVSSLVEAPNRGFSGHSLEAANTKRQELIEAGSYLKQDWLDQDHWRDLAAARGYRLPHWYLPLSSSGIESVLRDLGQGKKWFIESFGDLTYKQFASMNPKMPLWAFAGQCLEQVSST
jgi:hypothetical protein